MEKIQLRTFEISSCTESFTNTADDCNGTCYLVIKPGKNSVELLVSSNTQRIGLLGIIDQNK
jgi:hypothetical protein